MNKKKNNLLYFLRILNTNNLCYSMLPLGVLFYSKRRISEIIRKQNKLKWKSPFQEQKSKCHLD